MSEKNGIENESSSSLPHDEERASSGLAGCNNYPAKDEIIARLVQLREYTEKAEEALHALPAGSQSDAKFKQLQEMTAEMRTTEKRLMEALREYDVEEHPSSSKPDRVHQVVPNVVDDIPPALLAERQQLEQQCHDSQQRIASLEEERKFLLQLCAHEDTDTKKHSNIDEGCHTRSSRRAESTERILLAEDLVQAQKRGGGGNNSDKRFEIHNIITEIALLRRAKDESARNMLQQALDSGDLKNYKVPEESTSYRDIPSEMKSVAEEFGGDGDSISGASNTSVPLPDPFHESFGETISQKLMEIQLMREKLDALQSMVHNMPTPGTTNALDNEVAMASSSAAFNNDIEKEMMNPMHIQKPCPQMPMQNSSSERDLKRLLSDRESPAGFVPYNPSNLKLDGMAGPSGLHKPMPVQYRGHRFDPTIGLVGTGSMQSGTHSVTGSDKMNYSDHGYKHFEASRSQYMQGSAEFEQRRRAFLPENRTLASASVGDNDHGWMLFSSPPRTLDSGSRDHSETAAGNLTEKYVTESNILLKHICTSINAINMQLSDHKKQLHTIQDVVEKVLYHNNSWYGHGASTEPSRLYNRSRTDPGRNGCDSVNRDNKSPFFFPNELRENSSFGMPSGASINAQGINYELRGMNPIKRENPARDIWDSSEVVPTSGSHEQNLVPGPDSSYYGAATSSLHKIGRPWASPSIDSSRYMLNNQVPPGNRTNNYWDNFRSQSRQNVFSSNGKSNDSYNSLLDISPEGLHGQAVGVGYNNFSALNGRYDKNPGAKPLRGVMMKHFVENIGNKKRNQEQQQRKTAPQRSVSVGSMQTVNDALTSAHNASFSPSQRMCNDTSPGTSSAQGTRHHGKNPRSQNNVMNQLTPKEPNTRYDSGRDVMTEIFSRMSQLRSENLRQQTLDAVRSFVDQSLMEDEILGGEVGSISSEYSRPRTQAMQLPPKVSPNAPRPSGRLSDGSVWAEMNGTSSQREDFGRFDVYDTNNPYKITLGATGSFRPSERDLLGRHDRGVDVSRGLGTTIEERPSVSAWLSQAGNCEISSSPHVSARMHNNGNGEPDSSFSHSRRDMDLFFFSPRKAENIAKESLSKSLFSPEESSGGEDVRVTLETTASRKVRDLRTVDASIVVSKPCASSHLTSPRTSSTVRAGASQSREECDVTEENSSHSAMPKMGGASFTCEDNLTANNSSVQPSSSYSAMADLENLTVEHFRLDFGEDNGKISGTQRMSDLPNKPGADENGDTEGSPDIKQQ